MSGMDWMARQLSVQSGLRLEAPRYNPRPAGVMQGNGTSIKVFEFLQQYPGRYFTFGEILRRIDCTDKKLSWALIFLKSCGHIECSSDEGRNSRYLRYSYTGGKR